MQYYLNHTNFSFLDFRLEIPSKLVKATYVAATKLRITAAAKQCGKYLVENMTPGNCISKFDTLLLLFIFAFYIWNIFVYLAF